MSAWDWERLRQWDPCKNRDSQILASMTDSDVTSTGQAVPPHNVSQVASISAATSVCPFLVIGSEIVGNIAAC